MFDGRPSSKPRGTRVRLLLLIVLTAFAGRADARPAGPDTVYVRLNQVGYLPGEQKTAVLFSNQPIRKAVELVESSTGRVVHRARLEKADKTGWAPFPHVYACDFSAWTVPGRFMLRVPGRILASPVVRIDDAVYGAYHEDLLGFMRQQRCGYNPFLDVACHRLDGRTMYSPMPDSSFVDVSGGWHDAGDQLKYLITSSFATGSLLLAYRLMNDRFTDRVDALGRPGSNGRADVLDEARWGLDWLLKMAPGPGLLFHQVADDRDHKGWKWPDREISDYGWGVGSYRVAYFATGAPQGLRQYQSKATGVANLAGRTAAALAMGFQAWKDDPAERPYALLCLQRAIDTYRLGKAREGYQQGNSYGAPYRYTEDTWADDMEWGAAELFRATGDRTYLDDAIRYARLAGTTSWMGRDTTEHYQMYPFVNPGHFALYDQVDKTFQDTLAAFYRDGIEKTLQRASNNVYGIGVPFIWCSNNLVTALITQIDLYERMTGDRRYHALMLEHRDWLLGRNPWGSSMFTDIPRDGEYPVDVHTSIWALGRLEVPGGLVDGPIYGTIYRQLRGLTLTSPDEFAPFQSPYVVYHDDIGDYSTNEPTMDGTAGAVYVLALFAPPARR